MSGLIYIGKGDFINGIPAKDLTPEQVERFGRDYLIDSGLYADDSVLSEVKEALKENDNEEE